MRKYPCIHFKKFPPGHPKIGRWEVTIAASGREELRLTDNERKAFTFAIELNGRRGLPYTTWINGADHA